MLVEVPGRMECNLDRSRATLRVGRGATDTLSGTGRILAAVFHLGWVTSVDVTCLGRVFACRRRLNVRSGSAVQLWAVRSLVEWCARRSLLVVHARPPMR